jgi:uncharacterized protein YdcH (DUF465 family)
MIAAFTTPLLAGFKVIKDIADANKSLKNYCELERAVSDVYSKLKLANAEISVLTDENKALKDKIADIEKNAMDSVNFQLKSENYMLYKSKTGFLAYVLKPECEGIEPYHYLCDYCMENGKHRKLNVLNGKHASCKECGSQGFI